ncbi:hypothetical protein K7I13_11400 [Brucepastera parasyntrophica]|uniref:hypothetical protein n=1 Tax=Brucepastera parasyntrophica TaxID=2880008 RepID=UPI00210AC488|nr:hypothetical protein [Brucepastera parasyntrophica]ULQ59095.1 hypothetical protein K7I13_11335 [Brucepastera parasyntrophica]ULQ59106.1 hypothetical protein K7I13_11400 [Brucepastera parasyntrophica]
MASIIPEPFSKSKWAEKIYFSLKPFLESVEQKFGIAGMTVIGVPILFILGYFLIWPYLKKKDYTDGNFIFFVIIFFILLVVVVYIQIDLLLKRR